MNKIFTPIIKSIFVCFLTCNSIPIIAQYAWNNVQIGGGGFVTGIIYSKTEANLKYARTDVGGAYRWDALTNKWIPLMDWVNESQVGYLGVESMAIDPQNNNIVYFLVGTEYFNSGNTAILKSTDRGNTFTTINVTSQFKAHGNGMGRQNGERLAVDPKNSNILYCGTRKNGLFKSINGGSTWTNVSSFPVTTTSNDNGICFLVFDGSNATNGTTQTIYAGVSRTGTGNLYKSTDAGATWAAISGASTTYMPQRAALASDQTLYVTYGSECGPWYSGSTSGQVSKLSSSGTWTNITPTNYTNGTSFGGISVDPLNAQRLILSTSPIYSNLQYGSAYGDRFFYSINGGTSWTEKGSNFTLNTNGCTWISGQSIHWAGDIQFNPLSTNQVSVISGNGIFTNDNIASTTVTWKFDAVGLEETVALDITSIPGGPLFSVIGDYDGFKHTSVSTFAPQHSPTTGTSTGITYASGNTQKLVRVGNDMFYTTNQGALWTKTTAISGTKGKVALSYDGNTILHCPENSTTTYRSTNNGGAWSTCNGISINNAVPVSDPITNNKFYAYNNTTGALMVSTDGGANFSSVGNVGTGGSQIIRTVPENSNHLWIAMYNGGLRRSINGGVSFTTPSTTVTACTAVGMGMTATGKTYPTIFIWGTVSGITGLFRSIDQGVTWVRLNDDAHEYGGPGNGQFVIGDMNTYGSVYMSTVGRGIIYGLESTTCSPPAAPAVSNITLCQGSTASPLSATGTALKWYANNTTTTVLAASPTPITTTATATSYYVSQTVNACESNRAKLDVTVNTLPPASISTTGALTFCQGSSVTLNANTGSGLSYQWKNGTSNVGTNVSSYTASTSGNYSVVVTNTSNCTATSGSATVTATPSVAPLLSIGSDKGTSINSFNSVIITASLVNGGTTPIISWTKNGQSIGTNSNILNLGKPNNGDIIAASLTSNASCASPTTVSSNQLQFEIVTALENLDAMQSMMIYPNPVSGQINIAGLDVDFAYSIIDNTGRIISNGETTDKIDVSSLENGIYSLLIKYNEAQKIMKIIVD